ncbi:MAG: class I SAM-dependent methyltransferase [candidate division WOR-3 bacterium]
MEYRKFYELIGKYYPEEKINYSKPNSRIREKLIKEYLKREKGLIIDIGCGEGRYLKENIIGADISIEKLKKAKKKRNLSLLINLDIEGELCFRDNSFDFVLFSEVLEHLRFPEKALKNIFNILKPSGKLLLTVPHRLRRAIEYEDIKPLREYGIKEGTYGNKYIHRNFSKEEIASLLKKTGFEIVELYSIENELRGWGKFVLPFIKFPRFYKIIEPIYLNFVYNFLFETGLIKLQKKIFKEGMRLFTLSIKP